MTPEKETSKNKKRVCDLCNSQITGMPRISWRPFPSPVLPTVFIASSPTPVPHKEQEDEQLKMKGKKVLFCPKSRKTSARLDDDHRSN